MVSVSDEYEDAPQAPTVQEVFWDILDKMSGEPRSVLRLNLQQIHPWQYVWRVWYEGQKDWDGGTLDYDRTP